jgi:D-alanyl-lipoteichoic acid acyltransferase DltB (MBOAT superfamily)
MKVNKNLASFYFIFWGNLATKKLPKKTFGQKRKKKKKHCLAVEVPCLGFTLTELCVCFWCVFFLFAKGERECLLVSIGIRLPSPLVGSKPASKHSL